MNRKGRTGPTNRPIGSDVIQLCLRVAPGTAQRLRRFAEDRTLTMGAAAEAVVNAGLDQLEGMPHDPHHV